MHGERRQRELEQAGVGKPQREPGCAADRGEQYRLAEKEGKDRARVAPIVRSSSISPVRSDTAIVRMVRMPTAPGARSRRSWLC